MIHVHIDIRPAFQEMTCCVATAAHEKQRSRAVSQCIFTRVDSSIKDTQNWERPRNNWVLKGQLPLLPCILYIAIDKKYIYIYIHIYIYTHSPDERKNVWCFRIFHVSGICLDKAGLSTLLAKHTELDVQETSHDPTGSEPWNDAWTGLVLKYPQISLFRPMK